MPGIPICSLWLIPPAGSPLNTSLSNLITNKIPGLFKGPCIPFEPHMTITSCLPCEIDNPDELLQRIEFAEGDGDREVPEVTFKELVVGETFFTRLTIHLERNQQLVNLAKQCREKFAVNTGDQSAEEWVKTFVPHVSLVYSMEEVPLELCKLEVEKEGVEMGKCAWKGGRIVLVDTWRKLEDWKVIASRDI
ncbi:2',3'-cyclic-nucleotide 3'-phosphodiesterase [Pyronema omphalodes]|nr:2',3'-cyclic-nucleotide 3'-phosphodiesterase [Pyronema omphalodes]